MYKKTMMESTFEVSKNAFNKLEVRLLRIMHMKTNLLNGIGYFGTSESGVLESSRETPVERGIGDGRANRTR